MSEQIENIEKPEEKKKGKLSLQERSFIEKNCGRLSIPDIAAKLNRTVEPIKKYIRENNLVYIRPEGGGDASLYVDLGQKLRDRPYWKELEQQFTKNELEIFCDRWCSMMKQFRENVLATEELQMKQYITIEILTHRSMVNRKQAIDDIEMFQTLINEEMSKEMEFRDNEQIYNWNQQIGLAKTTQQAYTTEYNKLLGDSQKLLKDLKGTRDMRLHKAEEIGTTFMGLIKMLEQEDIRDRENMLAGLMQKSVKKTYQKYAQPHTYADKQIDLPILNSETIEMYDEEELKQQGEENGSEEDKENEE